jgi:hypothetical protein
VFQLLLGDGSRQCRPDIVLGLENGVLRWPLDFLASHGKQGARSEEDIKD